MPVSDLTNGAEGNAVKKDVHQRRIIRKGQATNILRYSLGLLIIIIVIGSFSILDAIIQGKKKW